MSPFPTSPAAAALRSVGAIGAWEGDDAVSPEELAAAQPSILSQVIAGERMNLRPRCDACGSVLLRDGAMGSWCPTCVTNGEEVPRQEQAPELDAHGLAALPVSEAVRRAHEAMVADLDRRQEDEGVLRSGFQMELTWNPRMRAFEAVADGRVMDALMEMGPAIRIKANL